MEHQKVFLTLRVEAGHGWLYVGNIFLSKDIQHVAKEVEIIKKY